MTTSKQGPALNKTGKELTKSERRALLLFWRLAEQRDWRRLQRATLADHAEVFEQWWGSVQTLAQHEADAGVSVPDEVSA